MKILESVSKILLKLLRFGLPTMKRPTKTNSVQMSKISKIQKAMDYLISNAELKYSREKCGGCAKVVRQAVEFGFCPEKVERVLSAKDYGPSYEKLGFKKIYSFTPEDDIDYKPGDIVVIKYNPHGHIAMFCKGVEPETGKKIECWISDFRQRDLYGGKIRDDNPDFDIYRYDEEN